MIAFGNYAPDASSFNAGSMPYMRGAQPTTEGWGPHPSLQPYFDALPGTVRGHALVRRTDGGFVIYAATQTNIYRYDQIGAWVSVGSGYHLADGDWWSFVKFGNRLLAANIGDNIQTIDIDANGDAEDLTDFACRALFRVGPHVVAIGLVDDPMRVRWCATNDARKWELQKLGASDNIFQDGGWPLAGASGDIGGYIFQHDLIQKMTWQPGQAFRFRFDDVAELGLVGKRALVRVGNAVFFLSNRGFCSLIGGQISYIGQGKVDETFDAEVDISRMGDVHAVADPLKPVVYFGYSSTANATEDFDRILGYNWQLGRWFRLEERFAMLASAATPGHTLESLDQFGNLDDLQFSLDSPVWTRGTPLFGLYNTDNRICFAQGAAMDATFETADIEHNAGARSLVTSAHLLSDCETATLQVGTKDTAFGNLNWKAAASRQQSGRFPVRSNGKYHRYRVTLSGEWSNCHGLDDVQVKRAGIR